MLKSRLRPGTEVGGGWSEAGDSVRVHRLAAPVRPNVRTSRAGYGAPRRQVTISGRMISYSRDIIGNIALNRLSPRYAGDGQQSACAGRQVARSTPGSTSNKTLRAGDMSARMGMVSRRPRARSFTRRRCITLALAIHNRFYPQTAEGTPGRVFPVPVIVSQWRRFAPTYAHGVITFEQQLSVVGTNMACSQRSGHPTCGEGDRQGTLRSPLALPFGEGRVSVYRHHHHRRMFPSLLRGSG